MLRWFHKAARYTTVRGTRVPLSGDKWTFHAKQGRKCPEAGQPLLFQHDGARPHTAELNRRVFAQHSKKCNFVIDLVVQPAQSPDLNVDDLAFFHSLQTDVTLVAKENRRQLLAAVQKCWEESRLRRWRAFGAVYTDHFQGFWRPEVTMTTSAIVEVALLTVSALSMATSTTS